MSFNTPLNKFQADKLSRNIQIIHQTPVPIFFVGMMGSGKSTLGKIFAEALQYNFVEMDETIEQQHNMTINEIFTNKGETFFREQENTLLRSLVKKERTVISCGGGTFANQNNINIINQNGVSVFLNVSSTVLESRLKNDTKRPLLKNNASITSILLKRISFYTQAHIMANITPNNTDSSIITIAKEVARHLS